MKLHKLTMALYVPKAPASQVNADTWNLANDWSNTTNPNGPWTYTDGAGSLFAHRSGPPPNTLASQS